MRTPCWQHVVKQELIRRYGNQSPAAADTRGRVDRIAHAAARRFIEEYEWLGNMGSARYCYGLLFGEHLAAAACYTTPAAPAAYSRLLGSNVAPHVFQLCRGATAYWAPRWAASTTISRSLRLLRADRGAQVVVAYSDPAAGEIGTVYQATNAYYLGMTDSRGPGMYIIGGRTYHARAVQKLFGSAAHEYLIAVDPTYKRIQRTRKHRYCYVLAKGLGKRAILEHLSPLLMPYPKRVAIEAGAVRNVSATRMIA